MLTLATHHKQIRDSGGTGDGVPGRETVFPRRVAALLASLWARDPLLTGMGLFLLALTVPLSLGLWLDPREILGARAWLKPTKFALSTGIYTLTLAWVLSFLPDWPRTRRVVARTTAAVMALEVALVTLQAGRGTTSHFNVGTPFDAAVFGVMGAAIFVQTATSVAVAVALWRHPFADRALGWALRLGMTITIAGALVGGLMTGPTAAQRADARASGRLVLAGAHTVGAPDGGPGLPVTGWSTQHGDLRVAHFAGLHAIQMLPLLTAVAFRRRSEQARVRLTLAVAGVYVLGVAALLVQAVRGLPLISVGWA
jgi:hypothetical protein